MGTGEGPDTALAQTAALWIAGVAGPIKSFPRCQADLHDVPSRNCGR
jgi:hypothetical protein